ncbi:MAG: deoxyribose-phosphate aldolase [candidate division WOR-3 bacterium]
MNIRAQAWAEEARKASLEPIGADETARVIDNTFLHPEATPDQVKEFIVKSLNYPFRAIVVGPNMVRVARELVPEGGPRLVSVAGFPMGFHALDVKMREAEISIKAGVSEIDYVIDISLAKDKDYRALENEAKALLSLGVPLKAILECGLLSEDEKEDSARALAGAGISFVKTSTGFLAGGATLYDVALLHFAVEGTGCGVKASGGIRTLEDLQRMRLAGADIIGTSYGLKIVQSAL